MQKTHENRSLAAGVHNIDLIELLNYTDPEGKHKTRFTIRIIPCVSPDVFKLMRLAPDRNAVRARHVAAVRDGMAGDGVCVCVCGL